MATTYGALMGQQNYAGNLPTGAQAAAMGIASQQQYYTLGNTVYSTAYTYYQNEPVSYENIQTGQITVTPQIQNGTVWFQWNQQYYQGLDNGLQQQQQLFETDRQAMQETARLQGEAQQRQEEASKRARALLERHLTKCQRQMLDNEGAFTLEVNDRLYCVRPGARVERLNKKTKRVESYFCIHPETHHRLPAYDVALSQKLLLEANEREFLSIANETRAA